MRKKYILLDLVELRVAGRKMGVKNVTTYKKRELLELLLEVEKNQSSNAAESAVDNAENASADVKIKKTENRKKEEKKDDIPAAEHDNVAEQAGTAESDLKMVSLSKTQKLIYIERTKHIRKQTINHQKMT